MARDWVRAGMSADKHEDRDKFPVQAKIFQKYTYLPRRTIWPTQPSASLAPEVNTSEVQQRKYESGQL